MSETNLRRLIKNMSPRLKEGEYVFCSIDKKTKIKEEFILGLFFEEEGKTVVLKKNIADILKLKYYSSMAWITLNVNSSLESIGLTAKVSTALADNGITCNVIAAYHHDHLFVSYKDRQKALTVLRNLSRDSMRLKL